MTTHWSGPPPPDFFTEDRIYQPVHDVGAGGVSTGISRGLTTWTVIFPSLISAVARPSTDSILSIRIHCFWSSVARAVESSPVTSLGAFVCSIDPLGREESVSTVSFAMRGALVPVNTSAPVDSLKRVGSAVEMTPVTSLKVFFGGVSEVSGGGVVREIISQAVSPSPVKHMRRMVRIVHFPMVVAINRSRGWYIYSINDQLIMISARVNVASVYCPS